MYRYGSFNDEEMLFILEEKFLNKF